MIERMEGQMEQKKPQKTSFWAKVAVLSHNLGSRDGMGSTKSSAKIQDWFYRAESFTDLIMSDAEHDQYWNILRDDPSKHNPDKTIGGFLLRESTAEDPFKSKKSFSFEKGKRILRIYPLNDAEKEITFETLVSGMKKVAEYIEINDKKLPKQRCLTLITYTASHAALFGRLGFTVEETPYLEGKRRFFEKTLSPINPKIKNQHSSIFVCSQSYDDIKNRYLGLNKSKEVILQNAAGLVPAF